MFKRLDIEYNYISTIIIKTINKNGKHNYTKTEIK